MEEKVSKAVSESPFPNIKLDLKDKKILSLLSINNRFTPSFIAKEIGVSKDTVRYRINKLKESKVILAPLLVINPYSLGLKFHTLFLKLKQINQNEELALIKFGVEQPSTMWVSTLGGEWDFVMNVYTKDRKHLNEIIKEIKDKFSDNISDILDLENYEFTKYENLPDGYLKENSIEKTKKVKRDVSFQSIIDKSPMTDNNPAHLNELDKKVLIELAKNPEITIADLAENLGVAFDTAKHRISNLIKDRVIMAFNPLINLVGIGIFAYILLLETKNIEDVKKIENFLINHSSSGYVVHSYGKWDWQVYLAAKNQFEFYKILREIRSEIGEDIREYSSLITIQDFKFTFTPQIVLDQIQKM